MSVFDKIFNWKFNTYNGELVKLANPKTTLATEYVLSAYSIVCFS